jgi:hypothetical protein
MKKLKLILVIFCISISANSLAQTDLGYFNTKVIGGKPVITCNMGNLVRALFEMNTSKFNQLVNYFGYTYDSEGGSYVANNSSAGIYSISKTIGEVRMIWVNDRFFADELKDQLEDVPFTTRDGYKIFAIQDNDVSNLKVIVTYKEHELGSGYVMIKRGY